MDTFLDLRDNQQSARWPKNQLQPPSDSGWGVTATRQREVLFLAFFVYGADNRPVFYMGETTLAGQTTSGANIYTGPMLQISGPWLGTTFNPGLVTRADTGNVTIAASVETATLVMTTNQNG